MAHLIQRRRNQPRKANHISLLSTCSFNDLSGGNHHAQIDDFEIVTLQNNADDILADVMDIAFDGRHHNLAGRLTLTSRGQAFFFHERNEMADSFLHHPR